jgi:uncharacterized protein (TIGR02246 family)
MKKFLPIASAVLVLAAAAHAQPSGGSSGDTSPLARLQTEWAAAANAKDSARLAALYSENGVLMPSNAPMAKGRPAIQAVWKGMMDQNARDIVLATVDRAITGDIGYEAGTYTFKMGAAGAPVASDKGKYLLTVRRGADGKWLIQNDIFNSDLPCSGGAK